MTNRVKPMLRIMAPRIKAQRTLAQHTLDPLTLALHTLAPLMFPASLC